MSEPNDNPLLEVGLAVPFDRILPVHLPPAAQALMAKAREGLAQVKGAAAPFSYAHTFDVLDRCTERLELAMTVAGHLESVKSTPELRQVYNAVRPEVSAFYAGIPLDPDLYRVLKAAAASPEANTLSGPKKRYVKKTLDDFKRNGAELDATGKTRLEAISRELAELTSKYSQNVVDATAAFELMIEDEKALAGLPDSAKAAAAESARSKEKSGYRFTLQAPSVIPVLTYLDDAAVREKIYRAYNRRGADAPWDNLSVTLQILALRKEQATLLGFSDFADLVLDDRMAKTGAAAKAFVRDLTERTRAAFQKENQDLLAYRRELEGKDAPKLQPWDVAYYAEKLRLSRYQFDEEELRPYFPLAQVLSGLFQTAERLYGVSIQKTDQMPGWHADVLSYELRDGQGALLGAFYVDVFPREEKRGGAWMNGLISGVLEGERVTPHLGLICANVTPPIGEQPALLNHDEVTTMFHEFGHLLHHMLSRVEVRSLAGTNVAWDFVELPSQIMENWCWEKEALDLFARHYQTKAPIPQALFEKMLAARSFRAANAQMRQLGFANLDLSLHTDYDPAKHGELLSYSKAMMARYAPAEFPDDYAFLMSFGHLFSGAVGYAAGYYSYKWAEVLDADAFTRFKKSGVFSQDVGRAFRAAVLERGDGEDPMTLFQSFMGRAPSLDALLERSGLLVGGQG